jgi:phosphoserine phosphatase
MAGNLDFYTSLRNRVQLLGGQSVQKFNEVRGLLSFTKGAEELIQELKEKGWRIGVVSGGFHEIIDEFLAPLELDFIRANRFIVASDLITGSLVPPIIGPTEKSEALKEFAANQGIPLEETVAIGDGANDREMILTAGKGIAFCAKRALQEIADVSINERDLRLLLNYL